MESLSLTLSRDTVRKVWGLANKLEDRTDAEHDALLELARFLDEVSRSGTHYAVSTHKGRKNPATF
jgi:hypothetical protein